MAEDMNKKLVKTVEIPIPGLSKPIKVPDVIILGLLGLVLITINWAALVRIVGWLLLIIAIAIAIIRYLKEPKPPTPPNP